MPVSHRETLKTQAVFYLTTLASMNFRLLEMSILPNHNLELHAPHAHVAFVAVWLVRVQAVKMHAVASGTSSAALGGPL